MKEKLFSNITADMTSHRALTMLHCSQKLSKRNQREKTQAMPLVLEIAEVQINKILKREVQVN